MNCGKQWSTISHRLHYHVYIVGQIPISQQNQETSQELSMPFNIKISDRAQPRIAKPGENEVMCISVYNVQIFIMYINFRHRVIPLALQWAIWICGIFLLSITQRGCQYTRTTSPFCNHFPNVFFSQLLDINSHGIWIWLVLGIHNHMLCSL